MVRRRESMDERQRKSGLGRHDRASQGEPRTARPGATSGARARGLRGQHVVDAYEPNLAHPERWRPDAEDVEGEPKPEHLPSGEARRDEEAR